MSDTNSLKISGICLEKQNWQTAEAMLAANPVVVFPLGAAAKEHGLHLPLNTDAITANWLSEQIGMRLPVVIAPIINISFYPAFVEYPGSISLRAETARDIFVDSCRSLAAFGAKRFYILNNGVSTEKPLSTAREILVNDGIQLEYLKLTNVFDKLPSELFQQTYGSHADEHETSLMLHIAPEVVDMSKAVDDGREGKGLLSRTSGKGVYSVSGVYGQATLATAEKGKLVANILVETVLADINGM